MSLDELGDLFGSIMAEPEKVEVKEEKPKKKKVEKPKKVVKPRSSKKTIVTKKVTNKEFEGLKKEIDDLKNQIKSIKEAIDKPQPIPQTKVEIKSPSILYEELRKKYQIPISISYLDLVKLLKTKSGEEDELKFIKRYRKSRQDFDLFFSLIN